ncbi:helix-turn-helix transcriptional regulator [Falsihalocynthiibacter arcticus]
MSARYVSMLETNRHQPKLETLGQLCDALGLSLVEFARKIEEAE